MSENVKWLVGSKKNKKYETTTWIRCVEIEDFVNKVEKKYKIVGVAFEGNNLGFIVDLETKGKGVEV